MSFYFVDRILSYEKGKKITGIKSITKNEGFYYPLPHGGRAISPAVISEALAQLSSWLMLVSTDFKYRSVLLTGEHTENISVCLQGDVVELEVEVISWDDEVVVSKSVAWVNGRKVQETTEARGYLIDSSELTDPELDRQMFEKLYRPKNQYEPLNQNLYTQNSFHRDDFYKNGIQFIDKVDSNTPAGEVKAYKSFSFTEEFFSDHFPRKPVVPGVILMTMVGEASQFLIKKDFDTVLKDQVLVPRVIKSARFRSFVEPGDHCEVQIKLKEHDMDRDIYHVRAMIFAGGKRVMQAHVELEWFDSSKSQAWFIDQCDELGLNPNV